MQFEHIQIQKDWDKNQPVFLRGRTALWMHFSWLQEEKTKFRCHIHSRNFVEYLKPYYPREFRWGKKCQFLACYISVPLPLLLKFKIEVLLPILFPAPFCFREGKHKELISHIPLTQHGIANIMYQFITKEFADTL